MRCAEVRLNIGVFVLGGLEPEEADELRGHLAFCPDCRDEVRELEQTGRALEAAPPLADPPRRLKEEILSHTRAEKLSLRSRNGSSRFGRLPPTLALAAAVTVVAVIALGIFLGLQAGSSVATVRLVSVEEDEDYWGVAELHPQPLGNQLVRLKLNNLDQPESGSFYAVWFLSGEEYISAGTFTAAPETTEVWLTAPPEARYYRTLLITEQTSMSNSAPGKHEVLTGEIPS